MSSTFPPIPEPAPLFRGEEPASGGAEPWEVEAVLTEAEAEYLAGLSDEFVEAGPADTETEAEWELEPEWEDPDGDPLALAAQELAHWAAPETLAEGQASFLPTDFLAAFFRKPTAGFEFDVHYGPIPALPARDGDVLSTHTKAADGFEVKLDNTRLEINLKPFETTDAGRTELRATADRIVAFVTDLATRCGTAAPVDLPGFIGARPFVHPDVSVPIGKLPIGGRFTGCSVWAAPQATLTVRLAKVGALVDRIEKSEGDGPGVALSGGRGERMGVRSEALYRARDQVRRARRAAPFSDALEGFLILLASYLWTSELPYRFPAPGARVDGRVDDYEPFGKAFLPINVKTPFPQVFETLLDATDQQMFRDRFAVGAARVNLFRLVLPGATLADGSKAFLPPGRTEPSGPSVHRRQKAAFPSASGSSTGVVPTWDDLVEHILDRTHRGWGDRLWVPLSHKVDVGVTRPRVLLELRRIGFAAVGQVRWKRFVLRMLELTKDLDH
ncbi:MAG: hypothetical protein QOK35_1822 [Pseudonocardiales bacterium]|jgi:hypothetical protein|nr:hypothetical protein [Pseudonocardiales bacterium]